jgi:small subunit ribosomal protein S13
MFKNLKKRSESVNIKFVNKYFLSNKRFLDAMTGVFGVNKHVANQILKLGGFSQNIKLVNIDNNFLKIVSDFFINYILVERGLKRYRNALLLDSKVSGNVRGIRLLNGLPVNGQRSHTNAKTVRKLFKAYKFEE